MEKPSKIKTAEEVLDDIWHKDSLTRGIAIKAMKLYANQFIIEKEKEIKASNWKTNRLSGNY